jgi:hypothetical protein
MGEKKETTLEELQSENLRLTTQITVLQDQVSRQENEIAKQRREVERLAAQKDDAYSQRNRLVAMIARMAASVGGDWRAGVGRHVGEAWDDDWRTVVFIDLPSGQISFHFHDSEKDLLRGLPAYPGEWDGHSDEEKWARIEVTL